MTGADLKRIRMKVAPDLSQADYARCLGYKDGESMHRYENGMRPIPHLLERLAELLDGQGTMPDHWRTVLEGEIRGDPGER